MKTKKKQLEDFSNLIIVSKTQTIQLKGGKDSTASESFIVIEDLIEVRSENP